MHLEPRSKTPSGRILSVALTSAALLGATHLIGAQSSQPTGTAQGGLVSVLVPGALQGRAAVQALGNDALRIAEENDMTVSGLTSLLLEDETVWLDPDGNVFFVDTFTPSLVQQLQPDSLATTTSAVLTEEEVFKLHSRPQAERTIYLDFTGHHSKNNNWNHNIMFPPFNTAGGTAVFTDKELKTIEAHFNRVSEDFAPFDVDVTTEEPPLDELTKNGATDTRWGIRCVLTQPTNGFGQGIGGVAFLNSFDDSIDNPCFAFNKGSNNGSMTASHEVGHALGLSHDGLNGQTYHPGTGGSGPTSWGPIMGAPFGRNLVQWSKGEYSGANNGQNDIRIINRSRNGVATLTDDHPDTIVPSMETLDFGCPQLGESVVEGVIEREDDVDMFRYNSLGGDVTISVEPVKGGPNLDLLLEVYDEAGSVIYSDNEINAIDATLALNLPPGEFTIGVQGIDRLPRYTQYGSIGEYTLTVSVPNWVSLGGGSGGSGFAPVLTGNGLVCEGELIDLAMASAPASSTGFLVYSMTPAQAALNAGKLVPAAGVNGAHVVRTDEQGRASLSMPAPAGVPAGTRVVYQLWVPSDEGYKVSNAVELLVP